MKIFVRKISFFIYLTSTVSFVYSQSKFVKEFIVDSKGDTIAGIVSISSRNFNKVKFVDGSGVSHSFSSNEIQSFYDNDWGLYITAPISLSVSGMNVVEITPTAPMTAFLETITQLNDLAIYGFRNSQYGQHYFIKKGNAPIEELILYEQVLEVNGKQLVQKDERYKNTLAKYLSDCPLLQDDIKKTNLSGRGLQTLVTKYADCKSETVKYSHPVDHGKWSWGVVAGWSTSAIDYATVDVLSANSTPFTRSSSFALGISANYLISQRSKKFSLLNELVYKKLETSRSTNSGQDRLNYSINYLRLNILVRYNFVKPATLKPFLLVGMSNNFAVSSKAQETYTAGAPDKLDVRGYEQGLLLGAGINRKKVDVFGRLEISNGFAPPNGEEKTTVRSIYIGLAWWFN